MSRFIRVILGRVSFLLAFLLCSLPAALAWGQTLPILPSPADAVADADGNLYVADIGLRTISKITPSGEVQVWAGKAGEAGGTDGLGSAARFQAPRALALAQGGTLYVVDGLVHGRNGGVIRKIDATGRVTTLAGNNSYGHVDGQGTQARLQSGLSIAADGSGNLYVAECVGATLRKISSDGLVTTVAGADDELAHVDGHGLAARFVAPCGVAADSAGNLYVADFANDTVRKMDPQGNVTTVAGAPWQAGSTDGPALAARFNWPRGIAADAHGALYIADTENHTIRKISSAGLVTTLAGLVGVAGTDDGQGALARFTYPDTVSVDAAGNVYVTDGNHAVRKISASGLVTTVTRPTAR